MRTMTRGVVLAAGLCLSLGGCSSKPTTTDQKPKEGPDQSNVGAAGQQALPKATLASFEPVSLDAGTKLEVRLSDGSPITGGAVSAMTRAKTTDLDAQTTAQLLGRLQPLVAEKGDVKDFAKRADSKPPPRTGTTVKTAFPPESDKARPDAVKADPSAPLKVLRHAPDGDVPIVPQLSVTFDQPMVALTSHADTIAKGVPVQVDPALPEGQWRWVGAKTLLFDPKAKRLPMATTYKVTIPGGTKGVNGQALGEAATWSFQTPPLSLKQSFPRYGKHERDQLIFLAFNQQIKPDAVIEHVSIKSSGVLWGKEQAAVQASAEDLAGDPEIKALADAAEPGTWMVVKAAQPLPYDKTVTVTIKRGAPSAEGPRVTTQDMSFNFRTYGQLKLVRHRCGWSGRCRPTDSFSLRFSNPLDADKFDPKLVKVEPSYATASISQSGNHITIGGIKPGRRSYKVTVDKSLTDRFDQKLEKDVTVKFDVGAADPVLYSNAGEFTILDASSAPVFSVFSLNYKKLRVKAWAVKPSDWEAYQQYRTNYRYYGQKKAVPPPGKQVMNAVIDVTGKPDELAQTGIALKKALGGKALGHIVLEIEPEEVTEGSKMPRYKPTIRTWVQATRIALDGFIDHGEFIGWATSLKDGEPIEGVTMTLGASGATATTDRTGIARIALPEYAKAKGADYLMGSKGGDMAMLPESFYYYQNRTSSWHKRAQSDSLRWYVFDDRAMYKPSEEVHLKGWLRVMENREGGGIRLLEGGKKITYRVVGSRGNEITKGETVTTSLGGFDLKFSLPDTPNLGHARVELRAPDAGVSGGYHNHSFQIQEFRTPEFEVSTSTSEGPFIAGEDARVTVKGKYYAGGGLPGAPASWSVQTTPSSYRPPNQTDYTFGAWVPWWIGGSNGNTEYKSFQGKTDTLGEHTLKMDFGQAAPPRPVSVRAQASVQDVNRQSWSATSTLLVHPSAHYVGLKTEKYFVKEGEPLKVDAIVSSIDGARLSARPVKIRAARVKYAWRKGRYIEELVDAQSCDFETPADGAHTCTFNTKVGGTYKITATTTDDKGRLNATQITRWVSGGQVPPARRVELEKVTLVPDKEEYQPGDKVKLLVQSPFTPAEGILSIRRHGIVETRRFTMKEATTTLEVPVTARHIPNLHVQVDLVGSAPRVGNDGKADATLPRRPAYASGALNVKVPPHQRKLDVALKPAATALSPGEQTSVDITVRDAAGKPVEGAEVALVVVDEAILALTGYSMSDPLAYFHSLRPADARDVHLRQYVVLAEPDALKMAEQAENEVEEDGDGFAKDDAMPGSVRRTRSKKFAAREMPAPSAAAPMMKAAMGDAPMAEGLALGGMGRGGGGMAPAEPAPNTPIAVRENFNPLAVFAPAKATDASGKTTVSYKLPDNLTRYRVMAVAVKGAEQYGHAESNVTARLPVMVRPSPPRFLNFGDTFELPVVVQNQTDKPITVQLAARATNVKLASAVGQSVTVPANDRVEVRFPAASEEAGTARFQIGAQAGTFADAQEFKLPVWTPATSEAFATYGVVDSGAVVQPVDTPGEVWEQFGGLQITTSSTAMQALTDAFLYLYAYPYECSEQISSRVLSVAALRDVLTAFKAEEMPSQAEIKAAMERDIKKVLSRQHYNGGFGLWRPNQTPWPYVTLHVTHALARAKQKGYTVPDQNISRAKNYLRNIERHIPHYYGEWTRRHIIAYALYVRNLLGDKDAAGARALLKRAGGLKGMSFESLGWLLGVMTGDKASAAELAEIRRHLGNRVTETAGAAHFASSIGADQGYLIMHSNRSADAIILEALIDDQPKSDLIPKIVKGLMAHRKRGRWGNTQENAFVLIALDKYFNTYEKQTPDFVARVWLGDQFAGEHKFKGRTTEEHQIEVPMRYVAKNVKKGGKLYLQKDGKGRMYYRLGMTYAPKDLFLAPAEHGFTVQRVYEPVDNDADVSRRADGAWVIKAGAKVRVKLTMVAPTRRYHVALVDPMPAGLESLNPALAVTGDVPQDASSSTGGGRWWWWSRTWYEHQNMRDERTEAFTSLLWGGVHSYTYYARATTPGEFVVPPAKAEEMYSPETFGRSGSDRVIVKD